MKGIVKIFSDPVVKLTYGFILSIILASPYLNKFTDNPVGIVAGVALFILVLLSLKFKKNLNATGVIILFLFTIASTAFIYFRYE